MKELKETELTSKQIQDLLDLHWQGRDPEIMYSEKFKVEHPNYNEIEPPPLYLSTGEPYLGLIDDEHMKRYILQEKGGQYYWHRNNQFD